MQWNALHTSLIRDIDIFPRSYTKRIRLLIFAQPKNLTSICIEVTSAKIFSRQLLSNKMSTRLEDLDYGNKNIMKINCSKQITKHFIFNLPWKISTRLVKDLSVKKGIPSDLKICDVSTPRRFICAPERTLASCLNHLARSAYLVTLFALKQSEADAVRRYL